MTLKLNKKQAFELTTVIADGEATPGEKKAFFEFIEKHPEVRQYYEEELWVKKLIREKVKYSKTPDHLRKAINEQLDTLSISNESSERFKKTKKIRRGKAVTGLSRKRAATVAGIAAVTVIGLFLSINLWFTSEEQIHTEAVLPSLEEHVLKHYASFDQQRPGADITSTSPDEIKREIADHYNISITVPQLKETELAGATYREFLQDYYTPFLQYKIDEEDFIYIFTFKIPEIEERMERNQNAVKECTGKNDYHISQLNGYDVVSWKWDNIWYVGISEHQGDKIVSLLPHQ